LDLRQSIRLEVLKLIIILLHCFALVITLAILINLKVILPIALYFLVPLTGLLSIIFCIRRNEIMLEIRASEIFQTLPDWPEYLTLSDILENV
jgi:hypothetical protein